MEIAEMINSVHTDWHEVRAEGHEIDDETIKNDLISKKIKGTLTNGYKIYTHKAYPGDSFKSQVACIKHYREQEAIAQGRRSRGQSE